LATVAHGTFSQAASLRRAVRVRASYQRTRGG
jgi:hypothetical protein